MLTLIILAVFYSIIEAASGDFSLFYILCGIVLVLCVVGGGLQVLFSIAAGAGMLVLIIYLIKYLSKK